LLTHSEWNIRSSPALYDVTCICVAALLASLDSTDQPPFAPAEFQQTCAPPEDKLLVESCFHNGDGDAVAYDNVDEPLRLDAGDDDGQEETQNPSRASLSYRDPTLTLSSLRGRSQWDCRACMMRVQIEKIVWLGTTK
jgi:hypothetical protein